jgi:outer membrane protein W
VRRLFVLALLAMAAPALAAPAAGDDDENPLAKPAKKVVPVHKKKPAAKGKKHKKEPPPEIELEAEPTPPPPPPPEPVVEEAKPLDEPAQPVADVEVTVAPPAHDDAARRFYVRAGVAVIKPLSSSRPMELANVDGAASLAVQDGPIVGSGATVSSATIPAIILGFNVTDHIALETVLGLPFTVKFEATGTLANDSIAPTALGIPTGVGPLGPELGEAKAAPPLITAVYKFLDPRATVRPFLGVGASILIAYDAKVTNPMLTAVSQPTMHVSPAPGMVFQGGVEARISKRWYARADVKYIAFMLANAEVDHIQVKTPDLPLFDHVEVGTAKMSVWVNPLIIQAGIGTDF